MSLAAQLCNVVLVITELTQCSGFLSLVKEQGRVARWGKSGDSPSLVPGAHRIFYGKPAFKSKTVFALRALLLVIDCITNHPPKHGVLIIA